MKGRPPLNRCIVKIDDAEMTAGGIIIPLEALKSNVGLVVQSAIDDVPRASQVALDENEMQSVIIDGTKYVSAHRDAILLIKK